MSNEPGLIAYLILSAFVFVMGVLCISIKRNAIGILMGIELILNAANINFIATARFIPAFAIEGQVFTVMVIVLAAAEAAIALAIILNFYNNHVTIDVDRGDDLKG